MKDQNIGLMGEFRVASELIRRGYNASITFGNAKATDIIVLNKSTYLRIEVKTCKNGEDFVTNYFPKYTDSDKLHPDIWVLFLPAKDIETGKDRFFILKHVEIEELQLIVNKGRKTEKGQGVDNIPVRLIEERKNEIENRWNLLSEII